MQTKLAFGCGQGVEVAATFVANTFLLFFLTNVVAIDPAMAGMIIFLSLVIDAIADPLIGSWSDRTRSRWGRRIPFMIIGLPIVSISLLLLFATPITGESIMAVGISLFFNIAVRVGTSVFALPYSALTAELTNDYDERSSLTAYRMAFGSLGTVIVLVPAFGLFFDTQASYVSRGSYVQLGILLASVVLVMGAVCIGGIFRPVMAISMRRAPPVLTSRSILQDFHDLTKNGSFLLLFTSCLIAVIIAGSISALNLYAYRYFWNLSGQLNQVPILSFQIGLLAGIPLTAWLLRRLEKRDVITGGLVMAGLSQCAMFLPHSASSAAGGEGTLILIVCLSIIWGSCNSLFFIAFQSMVADCVDEHEQKFGQRCEGLFFSSVIFSQKAATGIGSLIAGGILSTVGIKSSSAVSVQAAPSSAYLLGAVWALGHGIAFLTVVPVIRRYSLNRSHHRRLIEALDARREYSSILQEGATP